MKTVLLVFCIVGVVFCAFCLLSIFRAEKLADKERERNAMKYSKQKGETDNGKYNDNKGDEP